eukprot:9480441-Pyramimonas_sp.AAC.3
MCSSATFAHTVATQLRRRAQLKVYSVQERSKGLNFFLRVTSYVPSLLGPMRLLLFHVPAERM